ncbi:MAG: bile acid:sodium symporter family protein [Geminicoccaceae bacterium]|nr:MAG: bile acid:sodium symporter family protein [Geminicoccaceae bacterium]
MDQYVTSIFIPLGLAFIMGAVGLGLGWRDFGALRHQPLAVAAGLAGQMLLLPAAAFLIAWAFALPPLAAIGLVLVACVPGGVTSNFITVLARGDAALSVVLTALSTTLGVVTIPLVLALAVVVFDGALGLPDRLPLFDTVRAVLLVTAIPMGVGMTLRALQPRLADALLVPARQLATLVFALIVVLAFSGDWAVVETHWLSVGPAVLAFNLAAISLGFALGRLTGLGARATITLGVECGLQNVALALFLGGTVLGAPALMVPAILYVIAMNASALALIAHGRRLEPQPVRIRRR